MKIFIYKILKINKNIYTNENVEQEKKDAYVCTHTYKIEHCITWLNYVYAYTWSDLGGCAHVKSAVKR